MKDIKSLYLAAKNSGRQQDVNSYIECVRDFLENAPYQYISNLEYIISSSIGLSTLKEFVDMNGISIESYNEIMSCLENGIKKCRQQDQNDSVYKEAVSMMESFKQQYQNCFIMFEAFQDKVGDNYVEAYYKNFPLLRKAEKGKINLSGIVSKFGEACVPDMLIYTSKFGNPDIVLESLQSGTSKEKIVNKISKDGNINWETELTLQELSLFNIPKDCMGDFKIFSKYVNGKTFLDVASICKWIYFKHPSDKRTNILSNHGNMDIPLEPLVDDQENALVLAAYHSDGNQIIGFMILDKSDNKVYEVEGAFGIKAGQKYQFTKKSDGKLELSVDRNARFKKCDNSLVDFLKDGFFDDYNKKGYRDNIKYFDLDSSAKTESAIFSQWICESVKDIPNKSEDIVKKIYEKSLQGIVDSVKNHNVLVYRESVLTGNENIIQEYSSEEIKAMENLISFKEYQMTCLESASDIINLQSQIYSLYEEFEGLIEEDVATSVIPMLPGSNQKVVTNLNEEWLNNTQNKKTGEIPDYLKRNHDLGYGEEEPSKKSDQKPEDDHEPKLDDFKRPSAEEDKSDNKIVPYDYSQNDDKVDDQKSNDNLGDGDKKHHTNNYYYYTYTNSNNKNSNSFNRHHQDDHSTGKRINSNDNINSAMESGSWTIKDLLAIPVTELADLPEDYYDLYHEATSIIVSEANDLAVNLNDDIPQGKETTIFEKLKSMMMKLINYLIDLYGRLFPKTISSFAKLEKKFKANEKIQKACKDNDKILKVMEINIPHISGVDAALRDLIDFANTGKLPKHNMEDYQRVGTNKVIIYWGSYSEYSDEKDFQFCIATNSPAISADRIWRGIGNKSRMKVATYLSEGNLLKTFGIRMTDEHGRDLSMREIKYIMDYAKTKVDVTIELWRNKEARKNLLSILKGLTEITNHVYRTMNQAYREAVNLLKNVESGIYESKSPWELDIFGNDKLYIEEVQEFEEGIAASLLVNEKDMRPLNFEENLLVKKLFGKVKCIFMKAKAGYFAMTNRARTPFYRKLEDIPKEKVAYISSTTAIPSFESTMNEAVGDADDQKPESDNPIQDTMTDLDRKLSSTQQAIKKKVQGAVNTTRTIVKPFKRTSQWISNMVSNWKDANENDIKERLADPHSRSNLFSAIKSAIKYGSLFKAGLLLNPIILYLSLSKKFSNNSKEFRLRNEMIGEIKSELSIIDVKIQDADRAGDNKAKYQLMRFKNELNKKLIRVGGTKGMAKMI